MYCVVRQYTLKSPGDAGKIAGQARDGFLPIVTKVPGFAGYTIAANDKGDFITTGFFQDRNGADESVRLAADWVRDNVASAVQSPPKVLEGDVRIQERRSGEAGYGIFRRGRVQSGKLNDVLDFMREQLTPKVAALPGFIATTVLEVGPDEFVVLGAWRDRASAENGSAMAMPLMQANVGNLLTGPVEMIDGEIKLRHVNQSAL